MAVEKLNHMYINNLFFQLINVLCYNEENLFNKPKPTTDCRIKGREEY